MSERGKAKYVTIAAGSNTTVKNAPGSLYQVVVNQTGFGTVWLEDAKDLGVAPNFNASPTATTIAHFSVASNNTPASIEFDPGVGFDALTVAATSNTRFSIYYE